VGWVGGGPARAGNPRYASEQPAPPATLAFRQRLPTTNHGPANPSRAIRAYQSDPRRAQQAGPPPTQPTTSSPHPGPAKREHATQPLTNRPPYQAWSSSAERWAW